MSLVAHQANSCFLFWIAQVLMHLSTGNVIKDLFYAFTYSCALSSYGALGKFRVHSRLSP